MLTLVYATIAITAQLFIPASTVAADELPSSVNKILVDNCVRCHKAEKKSGGLVLETPESILTGGKSGAAILPGTLEESLIWQLVQPDGKPHMPPGKKQLDDAQLATLKSWIEESKPLQLEPTKSEAAPNSSQKENSGVTNWLPSPGIDPTLVIDLCIAQGCSDREIEQGELCSDADFIRRLYLDVLGRIPLPAERQAFLKESNSRKRDLWIERLTASEECAEHLAATWDTMLLGRNEGKLKERAAKGWHGYLRKVFHQNRPWNEVAEEILLARGDSKQRGHIWFLYEQSNKHQEIAESISRGFFGVDIACAQCHDHPIAPEIKQAHYWGLVGFYRRGRNEGVPNGFAVAESAIGGFEDYANALTGETESLELTFLKAKTIEEERPEDPAKQKDNDNFYVAVDKEARQPKFSRREKFVTEILRDHPLLARAMVNRWWGLLLGRGMVHPVDKMDSGHAPSHPELLDWLADDYRKSGYDNRRLMRAILRSRAYQSVSSGVSPADSFAHGLVKPLSAEALLRSWSQILNPQLNQNLGSTIRQHFPEILAEEEQTTLKQTLMLSNHPGWNKFFQFESDSVGESLKNLDRENPEQACKQIFLVAYGREPTEAEMEKIVSVLKSEDREWQKSVQQVLWALLTSAEFRFNH
ncbi:MAG: DUF1549 domain-containing protein [Planctomycetota bacterium]